MSCSPFDLRDYFLQELDAPQRRLVESHVKTCPACHAELDRLQLTESALLTLREEEIPQRIAFVSDPVFEPSPLRRFFSDFWGSAGRLGFASAAMLSTALVFFAMHKPAPAPVAVATTTTAGMQTAAAVSEGDIQARIDAAVAKAIGDMESRQVLKTKQLMADMERARAGLQLAEQELYQTQQRSATRVLRASNYGPPQIGEVQ